MSGTPACAQKRDGPFELYAVLAAERADRLERLADPAVVHRAPRGILLGRISAEARLVGLGPASRAARGRLQSSHLISIGALHLTGDPRRSREIFISEDFYELPDDLASAFGVRYP